ncbi:unnamed protein product [Closterium sp. Naga37s-1]|nr:unnamed protein product [Closterium sp. Naga37s-1]
MDAATIVLLSQTDHHLFEVAHPRLDVFDSPRCTRLATQAWTGRRLVALAAASIEPRLCDSDIAAVHSGSHVAQRPLGSDVARGAIPIRLCEDAYPGWISAADVAEGAIRRLSIGSESETREAGDAGYRDRRKGGGGECEGGGTAENGDMGVGVEEEADLAGEREAAVAFAEAARAEGDRYLWGGTTGPHFDCSGLGACLPLPLALPHGAAPRAQRGAQSAAALAAVVAVVAWSQQQGGSDVWHGCSAPCKLAECEASAHAVRSHSSAIACVYRRVRAVVASPVCTAMACCAAAILCSTAMPLLAATALSYESSTFSRPSLLDFSSWMPCGMVGVVAWWVWWHGGCDGMVACSAASICIGWSVGAARRLSAGQCVCFHSWGGTSSWPSSSTPLTFHTACSSLLSPAFLASLRTLLSPPCVQEAFCEPVCVDRIARGDLITCRCRSPSHGACLTGWQVFFGTTRATHVGIVTHAKLWHPHHHTPPLSTGSSPSHACDSNPSHAWRVVQVAFLHSSGRDDGHDGIVSDCLRLLLPCRPRRAHLSRGEARVLMEHAHGSNDACVCCLGVSSCSGKEGLGEEQERMSAEGGSRTCGAGEAGEWKVVKRWHVGSREEGEQGGEDSGQATVEGGQGQRWQGRMTLVATRTAGSEDAVLAEGGEGAADWGKGVEVCAQGRVAQHYGAQLRGFGCVLHTLPPSLAHIPPHLVLPLQV